MSTITLTPNAKVITRGQLQIAIDVWKDPDTTGESYEVVLYGNSASTGWKWAVQYMDSRIYLIPEYINRNGGLEVCWTRWLSELNDALRRIWGSGTGAPDDPQEPNDPDKPWETIAWRIKRLVIEDVNGVPQVRSP